MSDLIKKILSSRIDEAVEPTAGWQYADKAEKATTSANHYSAHAHLKDSELHAKLHAIVTSKPDISDAEIKQLRLTHGAAAKSAHEQAAKYNKIAATAHHSAFTKYTQEGSPVEAAHHYHQVMLHNFAAEQLHGTK